MGGHAMVTQLWECISSETAAGLCNVGLGEEEDISLLIEGIRMPIIGNLNEQ